VLANDSYVFGFTPCTDSLDLSLVSHTYLLRTGAIHLSVFSRALTMFVERSDNEQDELSRYWFVLAHRGHATIAADTLCATKHLARGVGINLHSVDRMPTKWPCGVIDTVTISIRYLTPTPLFGILAAGGQPDGNRQYQK
jgi:hypothetical protein